MDSLDIIQVFLILLVGGLITLGVCIWLLFLGSSTNEGRE